jgi:hypothetical protein
MSLFWLFVSAIDKAVFSLYYTDIFLSQGFATVFDEPREVSRASFLR